MITKVRVGSFKSLESLEVELGLVNVFVGANGSGKSNLLEAVGVLSAASFGRVDDESLLRRGVRPGVPQLYKSAFPHKKSERRPHIFFGAENSTGRYEVSLWNPINDPKPAWRFKSENLRRCTGEPIVSRAPYSRVAKEMNPEQGLAALKSVELKEADPARQLLELLRGYSIYCANTPTLRGMTPDQQGREPVGLSGMSYPQNNYLDRYALLYYAKVDGFGEKRGHGGRTAYDDARRHRPARFEGTSSKGPSTSLSPCGVPWS
ncbi:MAG TPA: AAA family ATPase [Terriglobia bacterium]|nr:AAA family ATPase [Terriglobia bacterium]